MFHKKTVRLARGSIEYYRVYCNKGYRLETHTQRLIYSDTIDIHISETLNGQETPVKTGAIFVILNNCLVRGNNKNKGGWKKDSSLRVMNDSMEKIWRQFRLTGKL